MSTIYGYTGKILRVDLTTGRISYEPSMKYAKEWLGGSGIDQWIVYKEVKPWVSPYEPANRLTFGAGPLVGTLAPGSCRLSAGSKNAMTSGIGTSNSCSFFGAELKFAGYDHIIIHGKAKNPVYLWINDDQIKIREASHIWGNTTWETVNSIRQELGSNDIQLVSIGPAGENLVRGACIIQNTGRALGRCGLGGVMGAKNLKAIAVRGSGGVEIAEQSRFMEAVDKILYRFGSSPKVAAWRRVGTNAALPAKQDTCGIPYKNFQYIALPDDLYAKIDQDKVQDRYRVRNLNGMSCPVAGGRYFAVNDGPHAGLRSEGYQFEALADFNGKLAIEDPSSCIKLNSYCNELGVDIDAVAGSIGWAMECYQRGIIDERDTDGLKLNWGDVGVILELTRKIAYREGFGNTLAEGCARAADLVGRGSDYYAMHIKGQDLYEVIRGAVGWGLGVCVSTRGGTHTTGAPVLETSTKGLDEELSRKIYDGVSTVTQPLVYEGKAKLVAFTERLHRVNNSLGICHFATVWSNPDALNFDDLAELYSAATGWETTEEDLRRAATRMLNVEKAFNILHAGFSRKDDYPTPRDLEEPIPTGSAAGWRLEKERWDQLLDEYYDINHWDKNTSYPTKKCLDELDLKEIADDLKKGGKLVE